MGLTTMVGLMIEEMSERRPASLGDLRRPGDGAVAERACKIGLGEAVDVINNPLILGTAGGGQALQIVI